MVHELLTAVPLSIMAAAIFALLARFARQPLIIGYIAGGVALGGHLGLGLVTDEGSIEAISEIGLIFLLFIIGLEIQVPRLLQAGRTIVVAGLLQFPLCVALAWWAMRSVGAPGRGDFDGLYLAIALSLSSTLIVVKLLVDKLEIATLAGKITLGILIFQDIWAIGFLAFQPNLERLEATPLLTSLAAGLLLVGAAALMSRLVLPALFRAIASVHELVIITAVAWCFLVAGVADWAGLSKEMGALIAGMVLGAFPYNIEVTSRLSGVRDFFVTLFFVTLGLRLPIPTADLLGLAAIASGVVIAGRFLVIGSLFALLRLDARTAGVVAVNLAQVSEFSLVIVSLGVGFGHVSDRVAVLVLYTLLITAVLSTYGILFNHEIGATIGRLLARAGAPIWLGNRRRQHEPRAAGPRPDIFLLGVSQEGLALMTHMLRDPRGMKDRVVAVDFNPETLELLHAAGIECHYGDIANVETLRHAGIEHARIAVSSISDAYLRGVDNLALLRLVRGAAPGARVIVTADTPKRAVELYAEGAAYVVIPTALSAEHLYHLLDDPSPTALDAARRRQTDDGGPPAASG
jgi:Kef-type K+ transport system membrane component KefB